MGTNHCVFVGRIKEIDAYDCDFIVEIIGQDNKVIVHVDASKNIMEHIRDYCKEGDIIGVKGHLTGGKYALGVFAEKISFLNSGKPIEEFEGR